MNASLTTTHTSWRMTYLAQASAGFVTSHAQMLTVAPKWSTSGFIGLQGAMLCLSFIIHIFGVEVACTYLSIY